MQTPLWFPLPFGRQLEAIRLTPDQRTCELVFCDSVFSITDGMQHCCEHRYMVCDDALADFAGSTLEGIGLVEVPAYHKGEMTHETQFLRLITTYGIATISNHNEHNGQYSGFLLMCSNRITMGE